MTRAGAAASGAAAIEGFNLSTGGTGLYRPGKWGLIKVSLRNPADHDVELLATTHFEGDPTLQYGRRFWMPPKSRMVTWHPLKMPALNNPEQRIFDLRSMVLSGSGGAETMSINEVGAMQFDQGFHVAANEAVTAMIVDGTAAEFKSPIYANSQEFALTARFDRGLRFNFTLLTDPLIPAGEELLDSLDHLIIASDRISHDAAGIGAIRRWVAAGGRLWIMADKVSPELLAALLGDEDPLIVVDRVDLTSVHTVAGAWSQVAMPFDRDCEKPIPFVRLIAEGLDVDFLVDGWPAAFHTTSGSGRILVTTLGADGWLRPRTRADSPPPGGSEFATAFMPSSPLSQLALDFFTPRPEPLIARELAEEQVRQLIGYAIPSRGLVVGTLLAFTGLILVAAVWFGRRGRLEWMGLVVPGLAIACAGILLAAGWACRSTIPVSTAIVQTVQTIPGTAHIRTSGMAGVFAKEAQASTLSGEQGGWMSPDMGGLEGTTRRMIWTDIDRWSWENFSSTPGLRMVPFQTAGQAEEPIEALAEFAADGIRGTLFLPPDMEPTDGLIVTSHGRIGTEIRSDGTFTAAADAVLGTEQYVAAHVLSDEQQRRHRILSQMLTPGSARVQSLVPTLLVWTRPWEAGTSLIHDRDTVGSALVSIPLQWTRPTKGTSINIPAPFLPFREFTGPDGVRPSGMFDARTGKWAERTGAVSGWLAFTVPANLLPLKVKSATLTFKVLGPLQRLELSTVVDSQRLSLRVWDNPVGTMTHEVVDLQALPLDARGQWLVRIDVGPTVKDQAPITTAQEPLATESDKVVSYWQIESVALQLSAAIP